jgi:hypothetical protein
MRLPRSQFYNKCMNDYHPLNHPIFYICIVILGAVLGGIIASPLYRPDGIIFGGLLGVAVGGVWGCLMQLANL